MMISVSDTGVGIAAAALPNIFDMFMQADDPTGQPRDGLGIGLTLARRLIELHDGRIHLAGSPKAFRESADPVVRQFIDGLADGPLPVW